MDSAVLTAVIGGGFSILTVVVTKLFDAQPFDYVSRKRRRAISGRWEGESQQNSGPSGGPETLPLTMKMEVFWFRIIRGTGEYRLPDGTVSEFKCRGGFLYDRFLRVHYDSVEDSIVQFGSVVMELSSDAKSLTGNFVGFGVDSQKIVHGLLKLQKK